MKLKIIYVAMFILLFTSGCTEKNNEVFEQTNDKDKSTYSESEKEEVISDEVQATNEREKSKGNQQIQYITEEYSFIKPNSWDDQFIVVETDSRDIFYAKEIHESNSEGEICSIETTKINGEWNQHPDAVFLASTDSLYYYLTKPTDVQFDGIQNQNLVEEYSKMVQDAHNIINSFILNDKDISYDETENVVQEVPQEIVNFQLDFIGIDINKIFDDAKFGTGMILESTERNATHFMPTYESRGIEKYYRYEYYLKDGSLIWTQLAVIDDIIVAVGFMINPSSVTVYQLTKDTAFSDVQPHIIDDNVLIWNTNNGKMVVEAFKAGSEYKAWGVFKYCFIEY